MGRKHSKKNQRHISRSNQISQIAYDSDDYSDVFERAGSITQQHTTTTHNMKVETRQLRRKMTDDTYLVEILRLVNSNQLSNIDGLDLVTEVKGLANGT
jgi:hypothetical protein